MKTARIIGATLVVAVMLLSSLSCGAYASIGGAIGAGEDDFGITKVYPTKEGGREWFIDMDDSEDRIFDPRTTIERQQDGS